MTERFSGELRLRSRGGGRVRSFSPGAEGVGLESDEDSRRGSGASVVDPVGTSPAVSGSGLARTTSLPHPEEAVRQKARTAARRADVFVLKPTTVARARALVLAEQADSLMRTFTILCRVERLPLFEVGAQNLRPSEKELRSLDRTGNVRSYVIAPLTYLLSTVLSPKTGRLQPKKVGEIRSVAAGRGERPRIRESTVEGGGAAGGCREARCRIVFDPATSTRPDGDLADVYYSSRYVPGRARAHPGALQRYGRIEETER